MTRQTGVVIDYFGHPPTDATIVDLAAEPAENIDGSQLDKDLASTCYKIAPDKNTLANCAALLFVNAEGIFLSFS